jgi:hypothetical protein
VALAVRSSTQAFNAVNSTTTSINAPAGNASGDLLVLVVIAEQRLAEASTTPPTGFVQAGSWANASTSTTQPAIAVFTKVDGGAEPSTYSIAGNGTSYAYAYVMMAISGGASGLGVALTASSATTGATALVAPAISPTSATDLLITVHAQDSSTATTYSTPAGMTLVQSFTGASSYARGGVFSQLLAASGTTGTRTSTSSLNAVYQAASFTLTPSLAAQLPRAGQLNQAVRRSNFY